jgi:hypothetical protein
MIFATWVRANSMRAAGAHQQPCKSRSTCPRQHAAHSQPRECARARRAKRRPTLPPLDHDAGHLVRAPWRRRLHPDPSRRVLQQRHEPAVALLLLVLWRRGVAGRHCRGRCAAAAAAAAGRQAEGHHERIGAVRWRHAQLRHKRAWGRGECWEAKANTAPGRSPKGRQGTVSGCREARRSLPQRPAILPVMPLAPRRPPHQPEALKARELPIECILLRPRRRERRGPLLERSRCCRQRAAAARDPVQQVCRTRGWLGLANIARAQGANASPPGRCRCARKVQQSLAAASCGPAVHCPTAPTHRVPLSCAMSATRCAGPRSARATARWRPSFNRVRSASSQSSSPWAGGRTAAAWRGGRC